MKKHKKNLGITLISLIVTIIIMMILAGVTINLITGNNGVINEAKDAKRQTEIADLKERIAIAILQVEAKVNSPTIDDVTQQLIESGIIESASQVDALTGDITVGYHIIEGMLEDYIGAGYEQYYGENVVPTDQKYFTFSINEDGKTATITGIKEEYAEYSYYTGFDNVEISLKCVINDNGTYITDVVIPYKYIDETGKSYMITTIGKLAFGPQEDFEYAWGWNYNEEARQFVEKDNMFKSFIIPNTINNIEESAFACCIKVEELVIPDSVLYIGDGAFCNCIKLTNIKLSNRIESIGNCAFSGCKNLKIMNIPSTVTTIGWRVFNNWTVNQTINFEILQANIPSGWSSSWKGDCYATINWGVSM